MKNQNVTLSLPKDILQEVKILALKRNSSLSGLLKELLTDLVESEKRYEEAMRHNITMLDEARALHNGEFTWSRESLHER